MYYIAREERHSRTAKYKIRGIFSATTDYRDTHLRRQAVSDHLHRIQAEGLASHGSTKNLSMAQHTHRKGEREGEREGERKGEEGGGIHKGLLSGKNRSC